MSKAQGLSLRVIIVTAIALIVLIVLWAIFTGKMGKTVSGLQECRDYKVSASAGPCPPGTVNIPNTNADYCCVEIGGVQGATISDPDNNPPR
jgi:hypothetical protein